MTALRFLLDALGAARALLAPTPVLVVHGNVTVVSGNQYAIGPDDECDCDDCEASDPDAGEANTYRLDGHAMWSLLEDAAIEARNGCTPQEAADTVLLNVEMKHAETTEGDE